MVRAARVGQHDPQHRQETTGDGRRRANAEETDDEQGQPGNDDEQRPAALGEVDTREYDGKGEDADDHEHDSDRACGSCPAAARARPVGRRVDEWRRRRGRRLGGKRWRVLLTQGRARLRGLDRF